jgi:hypothetical protein
MKLVHDLPRPIELRDPMWITLRAGCRLQDTGVTYAGKGVDRFAVSAGQPLSARLDST